MAKVKVVQIIPPGNGRNALVVDSMGRVWERKPITVKRDPPNDPAFIQDPGFYITSRSYKWVRFTDIPNAPRTDTLRKINKTSIPS